MSLLFDHINSFVIICLKNEFFSKSRDQTPAIHFDHHFLHPLIVLGTQNLGD